MDEERRCKHEEWRETLEMWAADERVATADEIRAAAAAEGLELVPSQSGETGYRGVYKNGGGFQARVRENGTFRCLGTFRTAIEAALCYARHIGAERAEAEAAEAKAVVVPLTADQARAAAAAEGLELVPSQSGETGYRGVYKKGGGFEARVRENGTKLCLGTFRTAIEAALCYARHIGAERAEAEAAEAKAVVVPLTADQARAAAAAEGLELVPSQSGETGYRGVYKNGGGFEAKVRENGTVRYLGTFQTAIEAALCYARHIGAERAEAEAAEAKAVVVPLTADQARAAAAAEGLELVPSQSGETGYRGVCKKGGGFVAKVRENGTVRYLGTFQTAIEAALCCARHIGAERAEAEAAEAKAVVVPLTADQARAAAAAEGLELVPSQSGETGYRGVCKKGGGFVAKVRENGTQLCLGTFRTAIEAALCYARHIGAERAEAEAAEAKAVVVPLTADQARAAAAAEGLELVPSQKGETGYRGVYKNGGGFVASLRENGTQLCLGTFRTAIEAALCYARHIDAKKVAAGQVAAGAERASAEEAEAAAGHRVKKQKARKQG